MSEVKINQVKKMLKMKNLWIILLSGILLRSQFVNGINMRQYIESKRTSRNLAGGQLAKSGQFPTQASLFYLWWPHITHGSHHFCAATILNKRFVVTAAHCIFEKKLDTNKYQIILPSRIMIIAGLVDLNYELYPRRNSRYGCKVIPHPLYEMSSTSSEYNVAVIQMNVPWEWMKTLKPASLPTAPPIENTKGVISGWGTEEDHRARSAKLRWIEVTIVNISVCNERLANFGMHLRLKEGTICASHQEEGPKDSCEGDSGGGLMQKNTLVGVVSGGVGCAGTRLPGWHADVFHTLEWIKSKIEKKSCRDLSRKKIDPSILELCKSIKPSFAGGNQKSKASQNIISFSINLIIMLSIVYSINFFQIIFQKIF